MKLNTYKADIVELSYNDLLKGLVKDLLSDESMPEKDNEEALWLVTELHNILEKYSA